MSIERYIDLFCTMLQSDNLKCTPIRQDILRVFFNNKHMSIEKLLCEVKTSKQTVYATLKLLMSYNIISKETHDNIPVYELTRGHNHFHMQCIACKKLVEFNDKQLEEHLQNFLEKSMFTSKHLNVTLYGTCKACSDNKYQ